MPLLTDRARIGEAIRAARVAAGLNRAEFGELFGVGLQTVGTWERGQVHFRPAALEVIAERLGIDPRDLTRAAGGARR